MFFYDKILNLYISDSPLLISSRVQDAGKKLGLNLKWNAKGYVHAVDQDTAITLAKELGSVTLSVKDFMHLAKRESRVRSSEFAEWLSNKYTCRNGIMYDEFDRVLFTKSARPGWFDLQDIDEEGLPREFINRSASEKWKFWTHDTEEFCAGAVRSFVTSSGTCSLDLGIPTFAHHANFMIREAYRGAPSSIEPPIEKIWKSYQDLVLQQSRNDAALESFLTNFSETSLLVHDDVDKFMIDKHKEMVCDLTGKRLLLDGVIAPRCHTIHWNDIVTALSVPQELIKAVVLGHPNPDADSIVTAVFEAARRTLLDSTKPTVAWAETVPVEVAHILGPTLTALVRRVKLEPHHEVILVDTQHSPAIATNLVTAVIDHHPITNVFPYYVSCSQEISWSSSLQVYFKYLGSAFELSKKAARILVEATMVEAEPELMHRMSKTDNLAFGRLQAIAGSTESYSDIMTIMTSEPDINARFRKDYKEDMFGFSVVKCRSLDNYNAQAAENNRRRSLPLTVVKQVLYDEDFSQVLHESIELVFNDDFHDFGFKDAVRDVVLSSCSAFHGNNKVSHTGDSIDVANGVFQTPRLLLLPLVRQIVKEHLRFLYSKQLNRFISCGFYGADQSGAIYGDPSQQSTTTAGLSYFDVKQLLANTDETTFLTLPEYWQVYQEFKDHKLMHRSLMSDSWVELLDSEILDGTSEQSTIINRGVATKAVIEPAVPAQLRPDDIGENGLPKQTVSANDYSDDTLWRYWSPDSSHNVATRGHIFVTARTCIDLKIAPSETTKRLTFRPIYRTIPQIKYQIVRKGDRHVEVLVFPRLFVVR